MARTATIRSASLAPEEVELVDRLASQLTGGSFTDLTRLFLHAFGAPLSRRIDELVAAGLDPHEQLVLAHATPDQTDSERQEFYGPSTWPVEGPRGPERRPD